jgi:hypothetical protein
MAVPTTDAQRSPWHPAQQRAPATFMPIHQSVTERPAQIFPFRSVINIGKPLRILMFRKPRRRETPIYTSTPEPSGRDFGLDACLSPEVPDNRLYHSILRRVNFTQALGPIDQPSSASGDGYELNFRFDGRELISCLDYGPHALIRGPIRVCSAPGGGYT